MAQFYRTPGVYVEEIPSGLKPMDAVGTSTLGVVGTAPIRDAHLHEPVPIVNFSQFKREFATDANGQVSTDTTDLVCAVMGFFQNGGRLCYVVNVGDTGGGPVPGQSGSGQGVDALDRIADVSIVAIPGFTDPVSYDIALTHCEQRKDRVAVLDGPGPDQFPADVSKLIESTEVAPAPPRRRAAAASGDDTGGDGDSAGEGDGDKPDAPPPAARSGGFKPRGSERGFGAFYVPHITIADPLNPTEIISAPPSGHIAGIYARTDGEVGVHRAPANATVRGAVGLGRHISSAEQEILNPEGVNCIRSFGREGILVWGARTLATDPEWKYVNVRRLFCMIEQTILVNTRWAVFQPNSEFLWGSIKRTATAFLTRVWRSGALFGSTPEEAFFVQCDAETNPPEVRDAGSVVTVIGVAPVKPAEFVVFQVTQHDGGEEITEGGA